MSKVKTEVLAIDAGGTMADTFIIDDKGNFIVGKAQTTPEDESEGIVKSMSDALDQWNLKVKDIMPDLKTAVYSGTALLNQLVSRKGRRTGLIVNKGMEDFLRMGRGVQTYLGYSYEDRLHLNTHKYEPPLIPIDLVRGVTERIDLFGNVAIPLREEEVKKAVEELIDEDVEAIAISLLHSYANPEHERRVRDIARQIVSEKGKNIQVYASVDYYPAFRELQRTNTVVVEASIADPSRKQLRKIDQRFRELGGKFDTRIMASHGGTISFEANELARTLVSGPIGGVVGSKELSSYLGYDNVVCSDIGGTSFDIAMITQGEYVYKYSPDMAKLVLAIPLLFMDSIGAGTGSYVRIDPHSKGITLGPDSAGYRVGTCWPEGNIDTVTVSDCHVVLGYINPDNFLGGHIKLDRERAYKAIEEQIAKPLGISVEKAAAGVIELLDYRMKYYLSSSISGKGYSPKDFVLFSYGGGGPLHTYGYTEDLGFEKVLIPAWAAGFSAYGCGAADFEYRNDASTLINIAPNATDGEKIREGKKLQAIWEDLKNNVIEEFKNAGIPKENVRFEFGCHMMYQGQLNDIEVASPVSKFETAEDWDKLTEAFEKLYSKVYHESAQSSEFGFTITTATVKGVTDVTKPKIPTEELQGETPPSKSLKGTRNMYWRDGWVSAQIYEMAELRAGNKIHGPAIIEDPATTFIVPPGYWTYLDQHRIFHLEKF